MTKEILALEGEGVNRLAHPGQARLSRADQVLISDDLINQLLLGETIKLLLSISHVVLPLAEVDGKGMVHPV